MNYYEHHLGDYAKDTAHLSILEHGAYRLLLDRYYGTELGIPADQVHRVARARSRDEKAAVDAVLQEFFILVEGVWKNNRAEQEIKKFSDKKPRSDEKKENDKERQRRARERRKALFEELSGLGVHMPWNTTTEQLQAEIERVKSQPYHAPVTEPVTRDNTATQTPDTKHQTPGKQSSLCTQPESREEPTDLATIPDPPIAEGQWLTWFNREASTSFDPSSRFDREGLWPIFRRWCDVGITQRQVADAVRKAQTDATEPIACLPKYVDRVLANSQRQARPAKPSAGQKTAEAAARWLESQGVQP